jgi:hypothetical protein
MLTPDYSGMTKGTCMHDTARIPKVNGTEDNTAYQNYSWSLKNTSGLIIPFY